MTSTQDVTERRLPLVTAPAESLEMVWSKPWGHACPDLLWKPRKAGKIWECWQLWPVVGGVGNGEAEEDGRWDLNPGVAAVQGLFGASQLGQRRTTDFYFFF